MAASAKEQEESELEALLAEAELLTAEEEQKEEIAEAQRDTFVGRERASSETSPTTGPRAISRTGSWFAASRSHSRRHSIPIPGSKGTSQDIRSRTSCPSKTLT